VTEPAAASEPSIYSDYVTVTVTETLPGPPPRAGPPAAHARRRASAAAPAASDPGPPACRFEAFSSSKTQTNVARIPARDVINATDLESSSARLGIAGPGLRPSQSRRTDYIRVHSSMSFRKKPFAILTGQSLYDDVTLGPYGTYDAQTYYFHKPVKAEVCINLHCPHFSFISNFAF
jgi:hypothetical protein